MLLRHLIAWSGHFLSVLMSVYMLIILYSFIAGGSPKGLCRLCFKQAGHLFLSYDYGEQPCKDLDLVLNISWIRLLYKKTIARLHIIGHLPDSFQLGRGT